MWSTNAKDVANLVSAFFVKVPDHARKELDLESVNGP